MSELTAPAAVRAIVQRYFVAPGESIQRIEPRGADTVVGTNCRQWRVAPLDLVPPLRQAGARLYVVTAYEYADPLPASEGFVVGSDGTTFHLNDAAEFVACFQRFADVLRPVDVAVLLATYQADALGGRAPERLVTSPEELQGRLPENGARLRPLRTTPLRGGGSALEFNTYHVARDPTTRRPVISVSAWRAEIDAQRRLRWSVEPLDAAPAQSPTG